MPQPVAEMTLLGMREEEWRIKLSGVEEERRPSEVMKKDINEWAKGESYLLLPLGTPYDKRITFGLAKSVMKSVGLLYEDENRVFHRMAGVTVENIAVFWKTYCKHTMGAVSTTRNNRIARLSKVFEAEWKRKGNPADFAIELCKRHEASDDIYKIFRDKMVPAIMPWKNEERKKHLARNRWTEVVNDRMEAVCVIFIKNYGGKWMGTGASNKWVDGKGKQGQSWPVAAREAWRKLHKDIKKERETEGEVRNRIAEFDEALYSESQPKIKVRKSRYDLESTAGEDEYEDEYSLGVQTVAVSAPLTPV